MPNELRRSSLQAGSPSDEDERRLNESETLRRIVAQYEHRLTVIERALNVASGRVLPLDRDTGKPGEERDESAAPSRLAQELADARASLAEQGARTAELEELLAESGRNNLEFYNVVAQLADERNARATLEDEVRAHRGRTGEVEADNHRLRVELESLHETVAAKDETLAALSGQIDDLSSQLTSASSQAQETLTLRREVDQVTAQLTDERASRGALEVDIRAHRERIGELEADNHRLSCELERLYEAFAAKDERIAALSVQIEDLSSRLASVSAEAQEASALRQEYELVAAQLDEERTARASLEEAASAHRNRTLELEAEKSRLDIELEKLHNAVAARDHTAAGLSAEILDLTARLNNATAAAEEVSSLRLELNSLRAELSDKHNANLGLEEVVSAHRDRVHEVENDNYRLRLELHSMHETVAAVQQELRAAQLGYEEASKRANDLEPLHRELAESEAQAKEALLEAMARIDDLEADRFAQNKSHEEALASSEALSRQVAELVHQLNEAQLARVEALSVAEVAVGLTEDAERERAEAEQAWFILMEETESQRGLCDQLQRRLAEYRGLHERLQAALEHAQHVEETLRRESSQTLAQERLGRVSAIHERDEALARARRKEDALAIIERSLANVRGEASELSATCAELRAQLVAATSIRNELGQQKTELIEQLDATRHQLGAQLDMLRGQLGGQLDEARSQLIESQRDNDRMRAELARTRAECASLQAKVQEEAEKTSVLTAEISALGARSAMLVQKSSLQMEAMITEAQSEKAKLAQLVDTVQSSKFWKLKRFLGGILGKR